MPRKVVYIIAGGLLGIVILFLIVGHLFNTRETPDDAVLNKYVQNKTYASLIITYPYDQTCFPPDMAPPTWCWTDETLAVDSWYLLFDFNDGRDRIIFRSDTTTWTPQVEAWQIIKRRSLENNTSLIILGIKSTESSRIVSQGQLSFYTSRDEVGAPIFYREVNLPFVDAVKDPSHIRWRFGPVSSVEQPPVILQNLPVCGNCHSFPRDGALLAMDVDYANSKGSYIITKISRQMVLATSDIITWNSYREEDGEQTFGLLSQSAP
jgi:hypothetical protein